VHITTDNDQMDKVGEAAQTMSRATHKSAYTAMDYALEAQEINTKLLQQTTQAWIDGFRYQAKLSQGMAQAFFGQWRNALASMPRMTPVELPVQRQSRSEVTGEPTTNGAQKVTETAAKDDQKNTEIAVKDDAQKKAEKAAEQTQKATETAAKSAQKSSEPAAEETQKSTEIAAKDAEETQKSTEIAAKDAQKNTETATFPIEGYDEMNVGEVSERLDGLSVDELRRVRKYEKDNKNRGTLRKEMKQRIKTTS
jgi:phosphate starvation-inducible protein PhoH